MKLVWIYLSAFLLIYKPSRAAFPPFMIRSCIRETKVKALDLGLLFGTDFEEASKVAKCYVTCLFDGTGFTANGAVSPTIVELAKSGDNTFFQMLSACKDVKSDVECELGYLLLKCFTQYGKNQLVSTPSDPADYEE